MHIADFLVQCAHFRALPNVKSVKFSLCIFLVAPIFEDLRSVVGDLYQLLKASKLRPQVIQLPAVELRVGYTKNGDLETLAVVSLNSQQQFSESDAEGNRPQRSSGCQNDLEDFDSWTRIAVSHLKIINFKDVRVPVGLLVSAVLEMMQLERLNVVDAILGKDLTWPDSMHPSDLLVAIKNRKQMANARPCSVSLSKIRLSQHEGDFSATDEDISAWISDKTDELLNSVRNAFTPVPRNLG